MTPQESSVAGRAKARARGSLRLHRLDVVRDLHRAADREGDRALLGDLERDVVQLRLVDVFQSLDPSFEMRGLDANAAAALLGGDRRGHDDAARAPAVASDHTPQTDAVA